jgi:hypothetical protein
LVARRLRLRGTASIVLLSRQRAPPWTSARFYLGRAHPTQRGNDKPMGSSQRWAPAPRLGLARRPVRLVLEKLHSIRSTPSRRPGAPAAWRMACRRDAVTSLRQRRIVSSSHPPLQIARGSSGSPSPAHPPRVTSERRGRPASPAGAHAVDLPDAAGRNGAVDPITDACLLHSCRSLVLLLGLPLPGTLLVYVLHSTSPLGSST